MKNIGRTRTIEVMDLSVAQLRQIASDYQQLCKRKRTLVEFSYCVTKGGNREGHTWTKITVPYIHAGEFFNFLTTVILNIQQSGRLLSKRLEILWVTA